MRVLHAPSNVANQSWSVAQGLRARGHHVEVWNYGPSPNGFPVGRVVEVGAEARGYLDVLHQALEADFDVYHFHTTRSLVPPVGGLPQMWDLPVLRALGRRVVFSMHGSDIRLASHHRDEDPWSWYRFADVPCDEERIAGRLALVRTYAHATTVSSVLDRPYLPEATYLPKSLHLPDYPAPASSGRARPLVVHATRRRATKGTAFIEESLQRLARRLPFDHVVLEGLSHRELLQALAQADVVVEKVLGGDAGVVSLEAMALGKVAVARIREEVRQVHPGMPVVGADPTTLDDVLAELVGSPGLRAELGEQGRAYVREHHSGDLAAERLERLYEAARPGPARPHPDWASDPSPRRLESAMERVRRLEEQNAALRARRAPAVLAAAPPAAPTPAAPAGRAPSATGSYRSLRAPGPFLDPRRADGERADRLGRGEVWLDGGYRTVAAPGDLWADAGDLDPRRQRELHSLRWLDVLRRTAPDGPEDHPLWREHARAWAGAWRAGAVPDAAWGLLCAAQRCQVLGAGLAAAAGPPDDLLLAAVRHHLDLLEAKALAPGSDGHVEEVLRSYLLGTAVLPEGHGRARAFLASLLAAKVDDLGLSPAGTVVRTLDRARWWSAAVDELSDLVEDAARVQERLAGARELLVHATRPDGSLVTGGAGPAVAWADLGPTSPAERYVASAGADGSPPASLDLVSEAGWAFSRSGWGETERDATEETFLSLRFGDTGLEGRHQDNSSLTLSAGGVDWLVDPTDPHGSAGLASRQMHSTVSLTSHTYRPRSRARLSRCADDGRLREHVLHDDAYAGAKLGRRVLHSRSGDYVVVVDEARAADPVAGSQVWLLAPDVRVTVDGATVRARRDGRTLHLVWLSEPSPVLHVETVHDEADPGRPVATRVSARFTGGRVVTALACAEDGADVTFEAHPVRGSDLAVDHRGPRGEERLVVTAVGSGLTGLDVDPGRAVALVTDRAVLGGRDPARDLELRLLVRQRLTAVKDRLHAAAGDVAARRDALAELTAFAQAEGVSGYRDHGLGAAMVDVAGHDLAGLVRGSPLVAGLRRTPLVAWGDDPSFRHAYYDVPVRTVRQVPGTVDEQDGRHLLSVDLGQLVLPVYVDPRPAGDTVVVLLHGATDRSRNTLPRFERLRSVGALGLGPLVAFSDPGLDLDATMILSWFAGTEDVDLHAAMAAVVRAVAVGLGRERVLLVGNSGGGLAALQVAAHLPQAAVVAFNPQVQVDRYVPRLARQAQHNLFGLPSVAAVPALAPRMDVIRRYGEIDFDRRVHLVQNTGDAHHHDEHFRPLVEAFAASGHLGNLLTATPDLGPGHRLPPPEDYLEHVRRGLAFARG